MYNSRYGGTHRLRFDSKGQGLGVAGRRDIRKINVVLLLKFMVKINQNNGFQ